MTTRNVSVRLSSDGAGKVKADLTGLAESGSASLTRLANTASLAVKAFIGFQAGRLIKDAIGGVVGFARETIDFAGRLAETADELGISVVSLQRYQYAASQVGVENEKLENAFQKLGLRIGEALAGDKNAAKIFDDLNVSLLDAQGLTRGTEAVFRDVVDAIGAMKSPTEQQAALAATLGDRLGPKMLNLVRQGTGALDEYGNEATRLGLILGEDVTRNADDVGDAIGSLAGVIGTAGRTVVLDLLPSAEAIRGFTRDVAAFFEEAIDGFRRFFGLQPDYDDTLDQIQERLVELRGKRDDLLKLEDAQSEQARRTAEDLAKVLATSEAGVSESTKRILEQLGHLKSEGTRVDQGLRQEQIRGAKVGVDEVDTELANLYVRLADLKREQALHAQQAPPGAGLEPPDDAARREREKQIERDVAAFERLRLALDPVTAANERFEESMHVIAASDAPNRVQLMAAVTLEWADALKAADKDGAAAEQRAREVAAAFGQVERALDPAKAALEDYTKRLDTLDRALADGTISLERHRELVGHAGAAYAESFGPASGLIVDITAKVDEQDDKFEGLTRAVEGFGRRSARVLADVVLGLDDANASFERLLQNLASDLIEQLIYDNITGPLATALGQLTRSFATSTATLADGGVLEAGRLSRFAQGGVVRGPTLFPMADGVGLMGEAGPEAVMPLRRLGNGRLGVEANGGGGVVINIFDQRSGDAPPVRQSERRGANGRREIDLFIEKRVEQSVRGGGLDGAFADVFGATRAPIMR